MASKTVRMVNVIPTTKIKKEILDDDDDCVSCKLCSKGFASEMALNNHAKIEHMEAWMSGEDVCLKKVVPNNKNKFTEAQLKEIKMKTERMLSSMQPTDMSALASADVGYIIIKDDSIPSDAKDIKRAKVDKSAREKAKEKKREEKEKEPIPITGPFECLQPSNFIADGTCHQMFFSCCEYSAHYRDEHTRRRKGLRCQVCERPLAAERAARHTCQTCGAGFEQEAQLAEHCASHTKRKPHQCSVCRKRFTQHGGLQQHMRAHTGDRPFPCTFCPKAFTQKSGLDQHLRIHTKYKPYRCVICGKTFCQSAHLQQHMRTHTNVAPFQCSVCEKRFKQSSHLNYHLKYHNPVNMTEEQRAKYARLLELVGPKLGKRERDAEVGQSDNEAGQSDYELGQSASDHDAGLSASDHYVAQSVSDHDAGQSVIDHDAGQSASDHVFVQSDHGLVESDHAFVAAQQLIEDGQEYVEIAELLEKENVHVKNVYILTNNTLVHPVVYQ
ncbi:zinc finger protein OZF-like [Zerene cesonia]|uniref:zinc finger protein OZF-like n=1 Tax=Zerene cesonia TaxID=33412 RepID=UPI0018E5905E|nr:zinc finger protein OZF-like [Zerene cesonia]XP_038221347.1 zinc finger protein OZF-like [Zerene cesonia]